MATQLQRAYGLTEDRQAIPKGSGSKPAKRETKGEGKKGEKADVSSGLPRRRMFA